MMFSMWLRDAVMSFAVSRYLTLGLRDAARVKDPHFTLTHHRVSSSSVIEHLYLITKGRGFESHLGLGFFGFPVGSIVIPFI